MRIDQHYLLCCTTQANCAQREMCTKQLHLPCLGSPFKLGMLYDCRTNKLIPGMTLWREGNHQIFSSTTPQEISAFKINSEDTFRQKASQLEAGADLQLGLLSGLVKVEGAAKFFFDRKTSKMMSRVTLNYKTTTEFEELTMDELGEVEFPEIFEKDIATHVVTRVEYGADAFVVFDQRTEKEQDLKKIEEGMIKSLLSLDAMSIEIGKGSAAITAADKIDEKKIECKFYSDVVLPACPTTYKDALKVCETLPKLMKSKSIAKKVKLLPLADLEKTSQRIVNEVSDSLFKKIQDLFEFMAEVEVRANDLIQSEASSCFTGINKELSHLKSLVDTYKCNVKTKIATLLPQIRAGKVSEAELEAVIEENDQSPFGQRCLSYLINEKGTEIRQLEQFLVSIKQKEQVIFAFTDQEFQSILETNGTQHVLCFDFNLHWGTNDVLKEMEAYLQGQKATQKKKPEHVPEPWYTGCELETIKKQMRLFAGHIEANPDKQKYVVTNGQSKLAKQASGEVCVISLYYNPLSPIKFDPLGPPGKPRVEKVTANSVQLVWEDSKQGSTNKINGYIVQYSQPGKRLISKNYVEPGRALVDNLLPNTTYRFAVQTKSFNGRSPLSLYNENVKTRATAPPVPSKQKFTRYLSQRNMIEEGSPKVYALPTKVTSSNNMIERRDVILGHRSRVAAASQKVIMLVGATGSGKTTLINGMANYILGVNWEDDVRFKLITEKTSEDQSKSQTKVITAYTFHREKSFSIPYSLTVIDTPGYGDTEGLERDKKITAQIQELFCSKNGIDQIHAVGFVVQSSLARLTPTQSYIFNAILSIFGKDIAENIFLMTTFADGEAPKVLDAVKTAEVPVQEKYFEFNNSALFTSRRTAINGIFWKMGIESFTCFFNTLHSLNVCSLKLTQEVLIERQCLEVCLEGLGPQIKAGLNEKSELEKTRHQLEQKEADMLANKDFNITVKVTKQQSIPLEGGLFTTTCMQCQYTCHLHCTISDDDKKYKCNSMTRLRLKKNTVCTVCPGKCSWTVHKNTPYRFEFYEVEEVKTLKEIQQRYEVAASSKNQLEELIAKINKRISEVDDIIEQMLQQARYSLCQLQEIALRPNPMSQEEYIELLIESEKQECKPGWEDRVKGLEDAKRKASVMKQVKKGDLDEFYIQETRPMNDPQGKSWFNKAAHGALQWVGKQVDKHV